MALYELDEISNCSIDALQCLEHRERRGGCVSGGVLVKFRWWLGVSQDVVAVRRVRAIERWSIHHTSLECNSAAGAIAASVTTGRRYQSYVASNGPAWLHTLLTAEAAS
ncbi:unnamed protein product [Brassica napus]|uniref:(rape) hypothetical protein n=1 Tax=Brassica napus TaxID=3708 RepID=A0A816PHG0_BRANA|nr:unnamed protein product [Brassica napus]